MMMKKTCMGNQEALGDLRRRLKGHDEQSNHHLHDHDHDDDYGHLHGHLAKSLYQPHPFHPSKQPLQRPRRVFHNPPPDLRRLPPHARFSSV